MPNRFIKESICTSESIDSLTPFQETAFYRLLVNCDDFGRFDARPKVLSSRLFPLKSVTVEEIQEALNAFIREGMIIIYTVDGKDYLQVANWSKHQQTRAIKPKYPGPDDGSLKTSDNSCNQMISDDNKCAGYSYSNSVFGIRYSDSDSERAGAMISDADAFATQMTHDRVLKAAEDAGFKMSNTVRAKIINLLENHTMDQMLNAIDECVTHGALNLAYLNGVLKGGPKKKNIDARDIHGYEQRDYSGEQEAAFKRLMSDYYDKSMDNGKSGESGPETQADAVRRMMEDDDDWSKASG